MQLTAPWHFASYLIIGAVAPIALVACENTECQATLSYQGAQVTGKGETQAAAADEACVNYCVEHDPTVDAKHRVWKAAGAQSSGDKAQDIADLPALRKIRDTCSQRCRDGAQPSDFRYEHCKG